MVRFWTSRSIELSVIRYLLSGSGVRRFRRFAQILTRGEVESSWFLLSGTGLVAGVVKRLGKPRSFALLLLSLFGLDVAAGGVAAFGVAAGADGEVDGEAEGGVSGADVFLQVVLVVFVKEAFVIHEEDVGGDRKGGVALVDRRSGVEEFEALLVLFVLRRRHFDHGIGEDAVEFARGERGLGVFTNLADGVEDEAEEVTSLAEMQLKGA